MNLFAPWLTDAAFHALPVRERFVLVAAYFCDVAKIHEQPPGSNRGAALDLWADEMGVGRGLPWCGIFATICLKRAGYAGPLPPDPASTHSWAAWACAKGLTVPLSQADRGDLFVLLFSPDTGHMGIILHPAQNGLAPTIEGNTNDDGGREGWEVARKKRNLLSSTKMLVVRLDLG